MEKNDSPTPPTSSSSGSSYPIRRRRNPAVLIRWLEEHPYNPYPTKAEKHWLAFYAGMTQRQLNDWFANARRNIKKVGYENWKKKHSGFSAILSGIPLQAGPNLAPTLLSNPQFATVGFAAASHIANCRAPAVPMTAATTTSACAYPVHGLDGYMSGQPALHASIPCSVQSNGDSTLHAPPHYNYGASQVQAQGEHHMNGAQAQNGRVQRPLESSQDANGEAGFNGNGANSYTTMPICTRRTLTEIPTTPLLSLPLNMALAPSYHRIQQPNGQSSGDSDASSPPQPSAMSAQHQIPSAWAVNGTTLLPQVGYAAADWQQLTIKPSVKQENGGSITSTEDGGFYDSSPGSLYR